MIFWFFQPILPQQTCKDIKLAISVYTCLQFLWKTCTGYIVCVIDDFGETGTDFFDWLKYKKHGGPHKKTKSGKICLSNTKFLSYPLVNKYLGSDRLCLVYFTKRTKNDRSDYRPFKFTLCITSQVKLVSKCNWVYPNKCSWTFVCGFFGDVVINSRSSILSWISFIKFRSPQNFECVL